MNKLIEIYRKYKIIDYIIIITVSVILSIQLYKVQILYGTHDGKYHLIRIINTFETIKLNQIPPIIAPTLYMNQGVAMNLFYQPISTYLTIIINLFINNYPVAMKFYAELFIIISGLTMYKMTFQITEKRSIALIAACFYILMPFNLGNIYKRYAMGEFTALAFLPLVYLGLYNLIHQDGRKHYYITIGASLVFLSHTITTYVCALVCAAYLFCNFKKINKYIIKKLAINLFFILMISMLFWAPLLQAKFTTDYVIFNNDIMATNGNYLQEMGADIRTLLFGHEDVRGAVLNIGFPIIILTIISFYCVRKVDSKYKKTYIIFLLLSLIMLFLSTKYFPWKYMPDFLCKLQFPWRFLGFSSIFLNFVCAINVYIVLNTFLKNNNIKLFILLLLLFLMYLVYSLILINNCIWTYSAKDEVKIIDLETEECINILNPDYYPLKLFKHKGGYVNYIIERGYDVWVLNGDANIKEIKREVLNFELNIENIEADTEIEFPLIFYPGYEAKMIYNGDIKKLEVIESKNGYVSISIESEYEAVTIELEYKGTLLTKISYITSAISVAIFIIYVIRVKKSFLNLDKK